MELKRRLTAVPPTTILPRMTIIDISRTLTHDLSVWPGSDPFVLETTMQKKQGASVNVTRMILGAHTGTHADAPYHFDDDGVTLEPVD